MSIYWSISFPKHFKINLSGFIQHHEHLTYDDVITIISKKHNVYSKFLKYSKMPHLDEEIPDDVEELSLSYKSESDYVTSDIEKFLLPDAYNTYELLMIKINIYVHNENVNNDRHQLNPWKNIEKKEITCIVKVIKETEHYYIIKLPDYYHINWGRGPSSESLYALLQKDPRYIFPIPIEEANFENIIVKYVKEYDNSQFYEFEFEWNVYESDVCCVCLTNKSRVYCYCDSFHLASCEQCIDQLTECPICRNTIFIHDNVSFIKHNDELNIHI